MLQRQPARVSPEPRGRRFAKRVPRPFYAQDRRRKIRRRRRRGDEAVYALLEKLRGSVVLSVDKHGRRATSRGLEHDQPIAFPRRWEQQAQRLPQRLVDLLEVDESRSDDGSVEGELSDQPEDVLPIGTVAVELGANEVAAALEPEELPE